MIDLNYIAEHISEFSSFITTTSVSRIIEEMNLEETVYSVKYMVLISMGGHIDGLNILIYRHFLLIGVITIKNKTIVHQELNNDGIDIKKYLPKTTDYNKNNPDRPSSQKKDNLFTELNVPYENDLTTTEKLDILSDYVNNNVNPLKDKGYKWMLRKNMKK